MDQPLYPDGHLGEYKLGLTLEDFAKDRFLYPPGDVRRYTAEALKRLGIPPDAVSFDVNSST